MSMRGGDWLLSGNPSIPLPVYTKKEGHSQLYTLFFKIAVQSLKSSFYNYLIQVILISPSSRERVILKPKPQLNTFLKSIS